MATKFDPAPESIKGLVWRMLREYHPALTEAGVTVGAFIASGWIEDNGESIEKPALKKHGRAVLTLIKVNSHSDRAGGTPDASLYVDNDRWNDFSDETQAAAIDSALTSLELVTDAKTGAVKLDAGGRPRLRVVPGDLHVSGHVSVVKRHGKDSLEAQQLVQAGRLVQGEFGWG